MFMFSDCSFEYSLKIISVFEEAIEMNEVISGRLTE